MNRLEKSPAQLYAYRLSLILIAAVVLAVVVLTSILIGTVEFSVSEILGLLQGRPQRELVNQIIVNIRIPRVFTGIFVGMNLAVAGVLLQGILRNPMASPNIIGVNAGAGLAAVVVMTMLPGRVGAIPPAAFLGALSAAMLIYLLSNASGKNSTVHIILAGIAVSNLMTAITSAIMTINSDSLGITFSWLLGSLSGRGWKAVSAIWPYSAAALAAALFLSPKVNLFALGDEVAGSVGLPVRFYRALIMITAAILAGSAVSVAGTIGFVGLIAPHSARLLIGTDHRYLVPLSAIFGAILLIASDTVARTIFQPVELSVGIITSTLGAPFFLILLYKKGKGRQI